MATEKPLAEILTPKNALIFRITHRKNLLWMLGNGLHCANSVCLDPDFVSIGNSEFIRARKPRPVPIPPGGELSDYVPFYFTPRSPMLLNILTGRGVPQRQAQELLATVDWLLQREGCQPELGAVKVGLASWPGGESAGQRKLRIFDDRLLELALGRLAA